MILARDIMTPNPICISAESEIHEAAEFFLKNFVSSAPVTDTHGKVLGQLAELGLMRALVRARIKDTPLHKVIDFKEQLSAPQFVLESTDIPEVVKGLIQSPVHRVLVQSAAGKLVGIISPKDVLRSLMGEGKNTTKLSDKLHQLDDQIKILSTHLADANSHLMQHTKFFETNQYMMHSADRNGKILMANVTLHQMLGYEHDELIGKTIFDIYPENLHTQIRDGLKKVIAEGGHKLIYSTMVKKNGQTVRVEVVSSSVSDPQGKFLSTFTISRPIDGDLLLKALHGVFDKP
jgi:PAS domain S-box-containing protein